MVEVEAEARHNFLHTFLCTVRATCSKKQVEAINWKIVIRRGSPLPIITKMNELNRYDRATVHLTMPPAREIVAIHKFSRRWRTEVENCALAVPELPRCDLVGGGAQYLNDSIGAVQ